MIVPVASGVRLNEMSTPTLSPAASAGTMHSTERAPAMLQLPDMTEALPIVSQVSSPLRLKVIWMRTLVVASGPELVTPTLEVDDPPAAGGGLIDGVPATRSASPVCARAGPAPSRNVPMMNEPPTTARRRGRTCHSFSVVASRQAVTARRCWR